MPSPSSRAAHTLTLVALAGLLSGCGGGSERGADGAKSGAVVFSDSSRAAPTSAAPEEANTEEYDHIEENDFLAVADHPLSTFSIDVDTASYSNVRRLLNDGRLPPRGAVRIEEFVNYFDYTYPPPTGEHPFSVTTDVTACPWRPEHQLVRIGLHGRELRPYDRGEANLVFLLDVSGSMSAPGKLPLVQRAMQLLVDQLEPGDRVAIVTYAGDAGTVLPSTPVSDRAAIRTALARLAAGGSTNGAGGIRAAYDVAAENFVEGGVNRVILCTDGDFNVGLTNRSELIPLIEGRARSGVFLTVLGFGMGNYKDGTMEQIADHGNGNYAYIDTENEAYKVLVEQLTGTLVTIAKDVKIQVDFNPARVGAYRLIGYENRLLADEDFLDDTKDAGEIGAGHTVTALYEIVPPGADVPGRGLVEPSKYAPPAGDSTDGATPSNEWLTVRLRYKQPDADESTGFDQPLEGDVVPFEGMPNDLRFAASVAAFGMLLRGSEHAGSATLEEVERIATGAAGDDPFGYRAEFVDLVRTARRLSTDLSGQ